MPRYKVNYTIEKWYEVEIEAESESEATDKFLEGDYEESLAECYGGELQDSYQVEEVVEEGEGND